MKVQVAFHNVDNSQALQNFIVKKSNRLSRFLWKSEHLNWVIESQANQFEPKLILKLKNKQIEIKSRAKNIHKAINEVIEKAQRLIIKDHKRLKELH